MAPEGYSRERFHETWREKHGWTAKSRHKRDANKAERNRNRSEERFFRSNWDAYEHFELYDMIWKANVGDMSARAGRWQSLAGSIESTTADVQRVMEQIMGAWRGQAAVRSAESNSRLMQWAGDASHTAGRVAAGMSDYADAVARAQNAMPEPGFTTAEENFRKGYSVGTHGGPSDALLLKELVSDGMVSQQQSRERKAEAVRVMTQYENQSQNVHDSTPKFTPAGPTTTSQPGWTPSGDDGPGPGPGPHDEVRPGPGGGTTTAAGYVDPRVGGGPSALGGTAPGGPGASGGSGGFAGVGAYGGGAGSLGSGGLRSGVGGMAGRMPGGAGALGARGGAAAGAFGGMPMGHGAQGEEDKEHKNKYDEGLDLFDDLPPAYPPVFGA